MRLSIGLRGPGQEEANYLDLALEVIGNMAQKRPYLISCASRTIGVERYEKTLKFLKDSVDPVTIWFDQYPGHLHRFDPLLRRDLDQKRWWIFTDCVDVIFQVPIPDLNKCNHDILVCDEKQIHSNVFWRPYIEQYPVFKPLLPFTSYNAGCQAMKGYVFVRFIQYIHRFRERLGPTIPQFLEQLIYNMWIQEHRYLIAEHPTLFTTLLLNMTQGYVEFSDGLFINPLREPFSIVHANGISKGWLNLVDYDRL
jgi:hypothetical protein